MKGRWPGPRHIHARSYFTNEFEQRRRDVVGVTRECELLDGRQQISSVYFYPQSLSLLIDACDKFPHSFKQSDVRVLWSGVIVNYAFFLTI